MSPRAILLYYIIYKTLPRVYHHEDPQYICSMRRRSSTLCSSVFVQNQFCQKWHFPKLEDKMRERGRPQKEHLHWWPILHETQQRLQLMSHQNSNRQTGIDENHINCEEDFVNKSYSGIFLPPSNWPVGGSLTEQQEPSSRTSQSWGLIPFASDAPPWLKLELQHKRIQRTWLEPPLIASPENTAL